MNERSGIWVYSEIRLCICPDEFNWCSGLGSLYATVHTAHSNMKNLLFLPLVAAQFDKYNSYLTYTGIRQWFQFFNLQLLLQDKHFTHARFNFHCWKTRLRLPWFATHSPFLFEGGYKNHFEQEWQRALHYHIVTHGDKAGSEIFTIHHTSLLLQRVMQRWKKPRKKRETRPGRNEPTGDITKNEF